MTTLESINAIRKLIAEVGITLVLEVFGILYLLKAYADFDWKVAGVGVLLAFGGVLFEFIVWSNDRAFWAVRLNSLDANSRSTQERIASIERALAATPPPGQPRPPPSAELR